VRGKRTTTGSSCSRQRREPEAGTGPLPACPGHRPKVDTLPFCRKLSWPGVLLHAPSPVAPRQPGLGKVTRSVAHRTRCRSQEALTARLPGAGASRGKGEILRAGAGTGTRPDLFLSYSGGSRGSIERVEMNQRVNATCSERKYRKEFGACRVNKHE
jgi:hypothetical protein